MQALTHSSIVPCLPVCKPGHTDGKLDRADQIRLQFRCDGVGTCGFFIGRRAHGRRERCKVKNRNPQQSSKSGGQSLGPPVPGPLVTRGGPQYPSPYPPLTSSRIVIPIYYTAHTTYVVCSVPVHPHMPVPYGWLPFHSTRKTSPGV